MSATSPAEENINNSKTKQMKKLLLLVCMAAMISPGAQAKKKSKVTKPVKKEVRQPAVKGLFNVQKHKDDYYFQIPDSLLGRLFLTTTRYISTPVDAGV